MNTTQTRIALDHLRRALGGPAGEPADRDLLARFVAGDEHAFASLVRRHGAMVLGVCRGVLSNPADADDAFQAVFLALARRAEHAGWRNSVAGWLHEVSWRTAVKLRGKVARRLAHERKAYKSDRRQVSCSELRETLDEEVRRLPAPCREAILLCYFHGETREQAALHLGWSLRTLERRLEQGRQLLRERLTARGTTLAVLLAVVPVAVPSALADRTVRAALGEASARVVELTGSILPGLVVSRGKSLFACLLLLGLAAGTVLALLPRTTAPVRAAVAPLAQRSATPPSLEEPLPEGALARLGSTRFWHGFFVHGIVYSTDGKIIASAGRGRGVCLWEADTGRLLRHFDSLRGLSISHSVALSPDGQYVASNEGLTLKLWSVKTGKEVRQLTGHTGNVLSVAYSPRGNLLASASDDYTVRIWDPTTGRQLHLLDGEGTGVNTLAFRGDGKMLASGSFDGAIRLWDTQTGKRLQLCKGHDKVILSLVFEPDGKRLVSSSLDGSVRVWSGETGNQERTLITGKEPVRGLAFAPDGKTLAAGVDDRSLRLLDFATGKELRRWYPDFFRAGCLAWSPDGKTLACGSTFDGTVHLWGPQAGQDKTPRSGHTGYVYHLAFHNGGQRLLSVGFDTRVLDWDLETKTGKPLHLSDARLAWKYVALTPDGKFLASASRKETDTTVRLFDTVTGKEERSFSGPTSGAGGIAFTPDGRHLASAGRDGTLRLWRVQTRALLWHTKMDVPKEGTAGIRDPLVFSPDGALLSYVGEDGILRLFDVATGKLLRKYADSRMDISSLAWSPDSALIAMSGQSAATIVLWNVRTGEVSQTWQSPKGGTSKVAFSPDGWLLASSDSNWDCVIHLREVVTSGEVASFKGHVFPAETLAFSPDGRRLASGSFDSLINIWDVTGRTKDGNVRPRPVTATRFAQLWDKLASDDAKAGHAAVWELVAGGEAVVPMLKARVSAAKALDARSAARIVAELDAGDYATRTKANKEAAKLGLGAEPALTKALADKLGLEPRRRVDALIAGWLRSGDWLRFRRAIAVLEHIGGAEAKQVLATLARGAEGARPTKEAAAALARLGERRGIHR